VDEMCDPRTTHVALMDVVGDVTERVVKTPGRGVVEVRRLRGCSCHCRGGNTGGEL
jgi:hypothetical protein